ncbi:MAG: hypothetical protein K0R65_2171 [Crocinitomicaceae bacterium]|jgi:hypothetical protein|nr:hypothetical protein [Crocinitomicaceae bacterium]
MTRKNLLSFLFLNILVTLSFSQERDIPKRGYAIDWIIPKAMSNPAIMQYERLELGVHLHDSVEKQVQSFLKKENNSNKLNPFNPEDIDIVAAFSWENSGQWVLKNNIYAFYYEDFKRATESKNLNDWHWTKQKTQDNFRIRYTPDTPGKWHFTVSIRVKGTEILKLGEYEFTCVASDKPGFVHVSDNKRYLEIGDKTFLPIGQNLPKPTCHYEKDAQGKVIKDEYNCSKCECAGYEEWCAHLKDLPMNMNAYLVFLKEIEKLKQAGGNYYRFFIFPHTYEIEYDKLGDYSSRMNVAWEMDKLFERSEQLDLKVHFNLFLGYPVAKAHYDVTAWDWYADGGDDKGYCYRNELGLKDPIEFLTNPLAKKHYKNRLRYIISRWGYSPSIAIIEMMSEINNKFGDYPNEIYQWHAEMTKYIKEELWHTNHLLAVNYDGAKPKEDQGDKSFGLPTVDVITHNIHRVNNKRKELQDAYKMYAAYNKPMFFSEIGTGDTEIERCDNNSEWIKDMWMTVFSGTCSSGINWNEQHNYALWENFKLVQAFVKDIDFDEYTAPEYFIRKDRMIEMLALNSTQKNKSIGVIQNLTWNHYTNMTAPACKPEYNPADQYKTFLSLKSEAKNKGIVLVNLSKRTEYKIDWYSPFSAAPIASGEVKSDRKGRIYMAHPELTKEIPFVLYKITKK